MEGNSGVTLCCGPSQENPESQPQKRLRPSAKPSVLAEVKGSVSASHQGTLNPTAQNPCQLSAPGISLKEAANVVVKCLTPFYKEGKFASKVGEWVGSAFSQAWGMWVSWGREAGSVSPRTRWARADWAGASPASVLPGACLAIGSWLWVALGVRAGSCSLLLFSLSFPGVV